MNKCTIWRLGLLVTGALFLGAPAWAQGSVESALREHVTVLTSDSLLGRGVGTAGEKRAAAYISRCLESYRLEFIYPKGVQDFLVVGQQGDTLSSQNIVAILVGSDPKLKEEYIVVGAHYDHLGSQNITIDGRDSLALYPGADDNASGVALLLEVAKAAAQQPYLFKRSLVFAAFGAEEMGMVGSWYFVNRAFAPIQQTVFMINMDMVGRSGSRNDFCAYTVAPHTELVNLLQMVDVLPNSMPKIVETDYFPSDHQNFFTNRIPAVLLTSGLHADYHRTGDVSNRLDYKEMENRLTYLTGLLQLAANENTLPSLASKSNHTQELSHIYSFGELSKLPTFQKGDVSKFMKEWVSKYVKYPNSAVAQGIQGRVLVQFVVEADGSVTHVEAAKSVDPLLDNEAVRVVAASPKWEAGRKNGKAVRSQCVVPVYFKLKRR